MEPKGTLLCSQDPTTGPYHEPDESSPHPPTVSVRTILMSSHLRLGLPSRLFPSGFPTKVLYALPISPMRATCPSHLIPDLITRIILWFSVQVMELIMHLRLSCRIYLRFFLLSLAPQPSLGLGLLLKIRLNFLEASQKYSFLQGRVNPTLIPHPGGPGLCIYIP
jgi:hypothetical protein